MYKIKPETAKSFIQDRDIRLPRFQRKQTWGETKNFQLCISVFKNYPIGVCILSRESGTNGEFRWLLDGRQRKNALTMMYEDPENIYNWARKFIKFKNSDQPDELSEKFWQKINEYLEEDSFIDKDSKNEASKNNNDITENEDSEVEDQHYEIDDNNKEDYQADKKGLDLLLEIIRITHNKKSNGTGFSSPFDFGNTVERVPYLDNGTNYLSSRKLKRFLDEYRNFCDRDYNYKELDSFYQFLNSRVTIKDAEKLNRKLHEKWDAILARIDILDKISSLLNRCEIGVIEVDGLTPSDSQKIFEIINSEGEKLTAVEILSAKPSWNVKITNKSGEMSEAVNALYRQMEIVPPEEDVVKWDLPATLLRRVDTSMVLKKFSREKNDKSDFEKELTIGFQIMAGIYEGSITKDSIEKLSKNSKIRWDIDYESFIEDLSIVLKLIRSSDYFRFLDSWRKSIHELTSLGCALNFILVSYTLWINSGKPIGNNSAARIFIKNCFILWDKLIYEYVNRQWSGSMDSKIANYLERVRNNNKDVFEPVAKEKWLQLLTDIFERLKIGDSDIKQELMEPLLYHYYCLSGISGPDTKCSIETDHIIPKTKFRESTDLPQKELIQDSLFNLALLPKNENISKSDKTLQVIESEWLIQEIEKYEQIPRDRFKHYSDIHNYKDLYSERKEHFDKAYGQKRSNLLNN